MYKSWLKQDSSLGLLRVEKVAFSPLLEGFGKSQRSGIAVSEDKTLALASLFLKYSVLSPKTSIPLLSSALTLTIRLIPGRVCSFQLLSLSHMIVVAQFLLIPQRELFNASSLRL